MSVGDICNREVVIIARESSILDAAKLMREYHVGDVVVVQESEGKRVPVGILTDRDVVVEILAQEIDLNAVAVGDAMSYELVVAREEDDIIDAIKRMRSKGVRRMPVVDYTGSLAGIVAIDDLIDLLAEQLRDIADLIGNEQTREKRARR